MQFDRISIELTDRCNKGCSFCYNGSSPAGANAWAPNEVLSFVKDCAQNGIRAVSFGGGEPLQYAGLFDVLAELKGLLFRSITTNGLLLDKAMDKLISVQPDKVHLSIHFPENEDEVARVIRQVSNLAQCGVKSGINMLVAASKLEAAKNAATLVRQAGISNDRVVYLPMRISDEPTPREVALVAGRTDFQSMSCLLNCQASARFCSVASDKTVAWCSYTPSRRLLPELTFAGLKTALTDLELIFCGVKQ